MAFNDFGGLVALPPGGEAYWWYTWGTINLGTQFASADVKTANGSTHIALNQGKRIDPDGTVIYTVTIRNVGSQWAWHKLQGGGLS
jgi:hypothetical protein